MCHNCYGWRNVNVKIVIDNSTFAIYAYASESERIYHQNWMMKELLQWVKNIFTIFGLRWIERIINSIWKEREKERKGWCARALVNLDHSTTQTHPTIDSFTLKMVIINKLIFHKIHIPQLNSAPEIYSFSVPIESLVMAKILLFFVFTLLRHATMMRMNILRKDAQRTFSSLFALRFSRVLFYPVLYEFRKS